MPVRLRSGARLDAIAGDGAGGSFFLCGEGDEERPVLYASSEGEAGHAAQLGQPGPVDPWALPPGAPGQRFGSRLGQRVLPVGAPAGVPAAGVCRATPS